MTYVSWRPAECLSHIRGTRLLKAVHAINMRHKHYLHNPLLTS